MAKIFVLLDTASARHERRHADFGQRNFVQASLPRSGAGETNGHLDFYCGVAAGRLLSSYQHLYRCAPFVLVRRTVHSAYRAAARMDDDLHRTGAWERCLAAGLLPGGQSIRFPVRPWRRRCAAAIGDRHGGGTTRDLRLRPAPERRAARIDRPVIGDVLVFALLRLRSSVVRYLLHASGIVALGVDLCRSQPEDVGDSFRRGVLRRSLLPLLLRHGPCSLCSVGAAALETGAASLG